MEKNQHMYMIVIVDKRLFAVNIKNIKSIIEPEKILSVSSANKNVFGIINLGNFLIPVFDAKCKMGYGISSKSERNRILLLYECIDGKELVFGVLVNDIHKILNTVDLQKYNDAIKDQEKIEFFSSIRFLDTGDVNVIKEFFEINETELL